MTFSWTTYFTLAQELLKAAPNSPLEETRLRSAISRAYYAVFNESRIFLEARIPNIVIPKTGKAHQVVPNLLISHNLSNQDWASVGNKLIILKRYRRQADYDDFVRKLPSTAKLSILEASAALALLRSL
jgi:uncharacterized protein (UPF0332 family)